MPVDCQQIFYRVWWQLVDGRDMELRAGSIERSSAEATAIAVVVAVLALVGVGAQYLPASPIDQSVDSDLLLVIMAIVIGVVSVAIVLAALLYSRRRHVSAKE